MNLVSEDMFKNLKRAVIQFFIRLSVGKSNNKLETSTTTALEEEQRMLYALSKSTYKSLFSFLGFHAD
jgi:hypothetical protein